jgi:hypothetical protein
MYNFWKRKWHNFFPFLHLKLIVKYDFFHVCNGNNIFMTYSLLCN